MKPLRPHQTQAIAMLRSSLGRGSRRPMVQAPTGFGKTLLAAHIIAGARAKGNRVIFVVPAVSLVDQTVAAFREVGIRDIGVMQADHEMTNRGQPVQVASIQTLARRQIPDAGLVIVDEAHRWFRFMGQWMARWDAVPFIGLSATPWTKGLGKHYDDLIVAATTRELIDAGYLCQFRVFAPSVPDLSGVRTQAGDWHEGDLGLAMDKQPLIADIVRTWLDIGENRPTLVFCVNRAHARHVQERFQAAGVQCGYIDHTTDRQDRNQIAKEFNRGDLRVVANVGCLTTGVDWDVRCIVLARPTKSEILFTQIIGRGLRTADGKADCLILDHSDTHVRLGFVTDIQHETLCDGSEKAKQERKEPLPKACPSCAFIKPPRTAVCPACGFVAAAQNVVEVAPGELQELRAKKKANREWLPSEKSSFYAELQGYAMERGYKSGWASHKYAARFGVWPNAYRGVEPKAPTQETLGWIKSQQIRDAKRRPAA